MSRRSWNRLRESKSNFRLTSYNILAQSYAENHTCLYGHIIQSGRYDLLRWENRWRAIEKELDSLKSDIFCLQEVQASHFHQNVFPFLSSRNYHSIYAKKDCNLVDGSLIAFDKNSFEFITHEVVTMFHEDFCQTGQIGIVVVLRHRQSQVVIIVATTHLVFNPYRGDWKMKQAIHLMAEINNQINKLDHHQSVPVIICGDMNSTPDSPLVNYFTDYEMEIKNLQCSKVSGQRPPNTNNYYKKRHSNQGMSPLSAMPFYASGLDPKRSCYASPEDIQNQNYEFKISKMIHLSSAYEGYHRPTTIVSDGNEAVMECLDYIFFSQKNLQLVRRLELPDQYEYIPNQNNGSDHLSLTAEFIFTA